LGFLLLIIFPKMNSALSQNLGDSFFKSSIFFIETAIEGAVRATGPGDYNALYFIRRDGADGVDTTASR